MPKAPKNTVSDIQWHPYWRAQTDDVVFKSSDGVQFRASSFRLSEASTVFAGMFEVAKGSGSHNHSKEVIELPYSSPVIHTFLDLACSFEPAAVPIDFKIVTDLIDMVTIYDCPRGRQRVNAALDKSCQTTPLQAMIHASNLNDVQMARRAMKNVNTYSNGTLHFGESSSSGTHFDHLTIFNNVDKFWKFVDALRPSWQRPFLRLVLNYNGHSVSVSQQWREVGENFHP